LAGAVAIAFAPIFVRLSEVEPSATAFWRMAFALPLLWVWRELERRSTPHAASPSPPDIWRLVAAGAFFAADLALWHWSIRFTTVANATLLANFAPIFVALGAYLIFGERFTRKFLFALALAIAGAFLLMGASVRMSAQHLIGDLLGIGTAVFYASYILAVGQLRARLSTATVMTWSSAVTTAALLPIALLSGESLVAPSLRGWLVLVGLAVISQAAGQSLIAYALAHLPAAFSSLTLLLQPVLAAVFAWVLLGERLTAMQFAGGAAVLVAISLARGGARRHREISPGRVS
jgi:drug/metabolite transporter (DMT)-like permease